MGQGPLPPNSTGALGPGYDGTPDGKINFNSELLSDLSPYAYGEPGRQGSQAGYQNIPHAVTRIIPAFKVPEPQKNGGDGWMMISHQVDDGELAFVVRCMFKEFALVADRKRLSQKGMLHAVDPIINLPTVNYILHGLQRYGAYINENNTIHEYKCWNILWDTLDLHNVFKKKWVEDFLQLCQEENGQGVERLETNKKRLMEMRHTLALHVIKHCITPFGVPRGSEKQGGQHQGVNFKSVTWPVDYVLSLLIDGKCSNMVNIWRNFEIHAGDDLCLCLKPENTSNYTLSSHPKSKVQKCFIHHPEVEVYQLVAGNTTNYDNDKEKFIQTAIWQDGYWHIGRNQTMQCKRDIIDKNCHSAPFLDGKLIECTFSPIWINGLCKPSNIAHTQTSKRRTPAKQLGDVKSPTQVTGMSANLPDVMPVRPLSAYITESMRVGKQDASVSFLMSQNAEIITQPKVKKARTTGGKLSPC